MVLESLLLTYIIFLCDFDIRFVVGRYDINISYNGLFWLYLYYVYGIKVKLVKGDIKWLKISVININK